VLGNSTWFEVVLDNFSALIFVAVEAQDANDWAPMFELLAPIGKGGLGHHHKVRSIDMAKLAHVCENGNALQRLS
jgi:hypothetical protein